MLQLFSHTQNVNSTIGMGSFIHHHVISNALKTCYALQEMRLKSVSTNYRDGACFYTDLMTSSQVMSCN
jgi:hypothetical protein